MPSIENDAVYDILLMGKKFSEKNSWTDYY